ncbi:DUF4224 domain-containing protein [Neisseriaceae bacterium B1]
MESIFLNKAELVELTGKSRFKAQIRVLSDLRIPFVVNAASRPVVARAAVERILGVSVSETSPSATQQRGWKSDVS